MSYFRTASEALHLAISDDALMWTPLRDNQPIWESSIGAKSVRDPQIGRDNDGIFHLFSTNGWHSRDILHATSRDLVHWENATIIPVIQHVENVRNCWAPECFYDRASKLYWVIWSSTVSENAEYDHRIWGTTTRDFIEYTKSEIFFDPGYNVIDATVVHHDDLYWMAWKDERGENQAGTDYKTIHICTTPRIGAIWSEKSVPLSPALTEGPALFRRGDEWTLFYSAKRILRYTGKNA